MLILGPARPPGPLGGGPGRSENFKRGGHNFHIFFKRIVFGRTNLKLIEKLVKL